MCFTELPMSVCERQHTSTGNNRSENSCQPIRAKFGRHDGSIEGANLAHVLRGGNARAPHLFASLSKRWESAGFWARGTDLTRAEILGGARFGFQACGLEGTSPHIANPSYDSDSSQ